MNTDKLLGKLKQEFGQNRVRHNEPMSPHTSFKTGGEAQYYLSVETLEELIKAVRLSRDLKLPVFVFGGGSNIIVSENGIKGLVIKNNCRRFEILQFSGKVANQKIDVNSVLVYVESGTVMNQLVRFCIEKGLGGLEYQLGLPGTVGGAICMNAQFPKKDKFVGEHIYKARIITKNGRMQDVDATYFRFGCDTSSLEKNGDIILSVLFRLKSDDKKILWERGMEALEYRNLIQPNSKSLGCTFRNIKIGNVFKKISFEASPSLGYCLEKTGLKGKRVGDAMISDFHDNFILNMGNASAKDVVELVDLIKLELLKRFNIQLHIKVKPVGYS